MGDQDESLRILGRTIARKREARGLTQDGVVGKLTDKSVENYGKIERGLRNVQFSTLFEIANALGVPIGELFEDLK